MFAKAVLFFWALSFLSQSAYCYSENPLYKKTLAEFLAQVKMDQKAVGMPQRYAAQFIAVQQAFEAADKAKRPLPTEQDIQRLEQQALINVYHTQCKKNPTVKINCESEKQEMAEFAKSKFYDSKFKPQEIEIPTYDSTTKKITTGSNLSIDLETGAIKKLTPSAQPAVGAVGAAAGAAQPVAAKGKADEKATDVATVDDANVAVGAEARYEANCEWSDLPRKILRGPGCYSDGTRICSGYVKCKGKKKYERLATCSESLCGDDQATACAKQLGYGSKSAAIADSRFTNSVEDTKKVKAAQ
jgi:hypothetical protein